jgi:hypothetical protein
MVITIALDFNVIIRAINAPCRVAVQEPIVNRGSPGYENGKSNHNITRKEFIAARRLSVFEKLILPNASMAKGKIRANAHTWRELLTATKTEKMTVVTIFDLGSIRCMKESPCENSVNLIKFSTPQ